MKALRFKKPVLALSPMLGITDSPFRLICKEAGADLLFTEMTIADSIIYPSKQGQIPPRIQKQLEFKKKEQPIFVQLTGSTPEKVAEAAEIVAKKVKPQGIDINMGCPAKTAARGGYGAVLLGNLPDAAKTVSLVKSASGLPVSVKMRSGLSSQDDPVNIAKTLEAAGAEFLSVHGRTGAQKYKGVSDWSVIDKVAKAVSIPVFGSGDMTGAGNIVRFLNTTSASGALIARGAIGAPWIFADVKSLLLKREINLDKIELLIEHAKLAWQFEGERGIIKLRKHLKGYLKEILENEPEKRREAREKLMAVRVVGDFLDACQVYFTN